VTAGFETTGFTPLDAPDLGGTWSGAFFSGGPEGEVVAGDALPGNGCAGANGFSALGRAPH
jgi:hypothetical protein